MVEYEYYVHFEGVTDGVAKLVLCDRDGPRRTIRWDEAAVPDDSDPGDYLRARVEDGDVVELTVDQALDTALDEELTRQVDQFRERALESTDDRTN
jgi:hypothetical protein